jgi:hypothetical protein
MVDLEQQIVGNQTLAFLSQKNGLHKHINHCDPTLPNRIDSYVASLREQGRGIWGTDPPKAIADIVESVVGAVYLDGGFSHGQMAALHALSPVLTTIRELISAGLVPSHPKKKLNEKCGDVIVLKEGIDPQCGSGSFAQRYVASLECVGFEIATVYDTSQTLAINKVCTLVISAIDQNHALENRITKVQRRLAQLKKPRY